MNRRYFLAGMAAASAAVKLKAAPEQVNLAVIGLGGRGKALVNAFLKVPGAGIEYLVDVDDRAVAPVAADLEKRTGKRPKVVADLRRALDDKAIHAVVIATPDHWHAPATILACDAGKDVYVEKPCAHNLREGRLMVDAARRNKRVVQHGTQARSRPSTIRAIEYVTSGKIGKVLMAKAFNVQQRKDIGRAADAPVPAGVDYDTWVGAAPWLPFNPNRFHYNWHWHWNFGTGDMGNDGAHQIDQARWALGVDYPLEVAGMARKLYFQDDQQTPDTMAITFTYPGNKMVMFEMRIWTPYGIDTVQNGVEIYGTEGKLVIGEWDRQWGFKVFDKNHKLVTYDNQGGAEAHQDNFVECVRSRKPPAAEIEIGHVSALHCHLGNIVARTGRNLKFDAKTETVTSDTEANTLVKRQYRQHWATPKGV